MSQHNGFLFIVVTNMQGIRYSHPETQRIGQPFKGDDILLALQGKENVAINRGFLAKALRVFTPVYDERHRQIGVVAIGPNSVTLRSRSTIAAAVLSGPFCSALWWGY